jgi:hypothetical protein
MNKTDLNPCPFCGKPFEVLPSENMEDHWAYKHNSPDCPMERNELTGWVWSAKDIMAQQFNARPAEDALRAELAEITAMRDALQAANRTYAISVCPELDATIAELQAELNETKEEEGKANAALIAEMAENDRLRAELRKWQTGEIAGIEFVPKMVDHLEAKNAKLREALNLACMYAQDDEHDWADIVRVTSNALLGINPLEVE